MRKVTATYYDKGNKTVVGLFHQWAAQYEEFREGFGNYTVALVEDETGQIRECFPDSVLFHDRPGDERDISTIDISV